MPRPKWSHVTIALAVIAALAIASPVFGISKSIKKAIKKEVRKQIAHAIGPAGTNGTNGTNGGTNLTENIGTGSNGGNAIVAAGADVTQLGLNCPTGQKATGGGAVAVKQINGTIDPLFALAESAARSSGGQSVGWEISGHNGDAGAPIVVSVHVVCASP